MSTDSLYIGVDVGTSSVRVVVIGKGGRVLDSCTKPLTIHNPEPEHFYQSSDEIWKCVQSSMSRLCSNLDVSRIKGIGFTGTCSLVVLDKQGPTNLAQDPSGLTHNIVMWLDHRAKTETEFINATKHDALKSVGGAISLEMQPPKLMWLQKNMPMKFENAAHFMDLVDFLTFKCTGNATRSQCTVVCKWLYHANEGASTWNDDFWKTAVLDCFVKNHAKIGTTTVPPGTAIDSGLCSKIAENLGLSIGTPVGAGLIDAHAGVLALLASVAKLGLDPLTSLCIISGTSVCHMALSSTPQYIPGVWGPYYGAIMPGKWLNEAGQSAVGNVLDRLLSRYNLSHEQVLDYIEEQGDHLSRAQIAKDLHVWPDYHGNRSPFSNPNMTGAVVGLRLDDVHATDETALQQCARQYVAHVQSFAYITKLIVTSMPSYKFTSIALCGGLQQNALYVQTHADVMELPVVLPNCEHPVALGAAMLGMCASGATLETSMAHLAPDATVVQPNAATTAFHARKYKIFQKLGEVVMLAASSS